LKKAAQIYIGTWRIVWMEIWDAEYVDMEVAAHIIIRKDLTGEFQFGSVQGQLDGRAGAVAKPSRFDFSWSGFDENDSVSGRGWLEVDGDQAKGWLQFHFGDETALKAKRR